MYLSHFGLAEAPFRITPHTDFFFEGANRGATLEALLYAVQHDEGIIKVSGEVGSGKTMLCRVLLERLPSTVETIYIATPSLSRDEVLRTICEDLKVDARGKRTTVLLRALQEHLIERYGQGARVVVLIDEAHAMPPETLEEIRLLSNLESNRHKLLQIVLFGQPELEAHLNQPAMRPLKERITHSFRLGPLVRADIDSYIDFRMRAAGYRGRNAFSPAAQKVLSKASEGLTRRINILADKSLLAAFADGSHEITAKHARAAVNDSEFARIESRGPSRAIRIGLGGLTLGLALGLGAMYFLLPGARSPGSASPLSPLSAHDPAVAAPSPGGPDTRTTETAPAAAAPLERAPAVSELAAKSTSASNDETPSVRAAGAGDGKAMTAAATALLTEASIAPAATPAPAPPVSAGPAPVNLGPAIAVSAHTKQSVVAMTPEQLERAPRTEPLARKRYFATQDWLQSTASTRYSVQLLVASEGDLPWVENFLIQAADRVGSEQLYVYSWRANGRQNYRVAYGNFETVKQGLEAIEALPGPMRNFKPYPETIAVMRRLNAQD